MRRRLAIVGEVRRHDHFTHLATTDALLQDIEADLAKVSLNQKCRVIPEAYPDHQYEGQVVEIAPEASRQKGTLQIKVRIHSPDRFLTPELTAKVVFAK